MSGRSFAGRYDVKFDSKQHRASVPIELRAILGETFVISKPKVSEKCLFAYTSEDWGQLLEEVSEKSTTANGRAHQRVLGANSKIVSTDKQGRVTIPEFLCEKVDLENIEKVLFIGAGRRIEIWNPDCFEEEMARIESMEEEEEADYHF